MELSGRRCWVSCHQSGQSGDDILELDSTGGCLIPLTCKNPLNCTF